METYRSCENYKERKRKKRVTLLNVTLALFSFQVGFCFGYIVLAWLFEKFVSEQYIGHYVVLAFLGASWGAIADEARKHPTRL